MEHFFRIHNIVVKVNLSKQRKIDLHQFCFQFLVTQSYK